MARRTKSKRTAKKKQSNIPLAKILLILVAVAVVGYLALNELTKRTIKTMVRGVNPFLNVDYKGTYFTHDGAFGMKLVNITSEMGEEAQGVRMDRLEFRPGDRWWLVKNAFRSKSNRRLPNKLGFTGVNMEPITGGTLDPTSLTYLPFENLGCADGLSASDLYEMGISSLKSTLSVDYDLRGSEFEFRYQVSNPEVSDVKVNATLINKNGAFNQRDPSQDLPFVSLNALTADFNDQGFITKRNQYCAEKAGIDHFGFMDKHMSEIDGHLMEADLYPGEPVLEAYQTFAQDGGRLVVDMRNRVDSSLMSVFQSLQESQDPLRSVLGHYSLSLSLDGQNKQYAQVSRYPRADNLLADQEPEASVDLSAMPELLSQIQYQQLQLLKGKQVTVTTKLGSTYQGEVLAYSRPMFKLQANADANFQIMNINKRDVVDIQYTSALPVELPEALKKARAEAAARAQAAKQKAAQASEQGSDEAENSEETAGNIAQGTMQTPQSNLVMPAVGDAIDYPTAELLKGKTIQVTTKLGSTYTGKLLMYTKTVLRMKNNSNDVVMMVNKRDVRKLVYVGETDAVVPAEAVKQ